MRVISVVAAWSLQRKVKLKWGRKLRKYYKYFNTWKSAMPVSEFK